MTRKYTNTRGYLTERSSRAPHNLAERKAYFETLLENLRSSRIPELREYSLEPEFDSKNMYEMTLKSKYPYGTPDLIFNYAVYEPIIEWRNGAITGQLHYHEAVNWIKKFEELVDFLDNLLPLIDDATLTAYGFSKRR